MKMIIFVVVMGLMVVFVFVDGYIIGDVVVGENVFKCQCVLCYVVKDDVGNIFVGCLVWIGLNLFDLVGGVFGFVEGFNYSVSFVFVGEIGVVWDEVIFVVYVMDLIIWLCDMFEDFCVWLWMLFCVCNFEDVINFYVYFV